MSRIKNQKKPKGNTKIPDSATSSKESTDGHNPSFRFTYADENRHCLSLWTSNEIKDLIKSLKKIEKYTWGQIKSQGSKAPGSSVGCGYKQISSHPALPPELSEDISISEMRVCETKRIFGFKLNSLYYIIWFDRNHSICK